MTQEEILIAKLTRFLKERGAYDKFLLNLKGSKFEWIDELAEYQTSWCVPENTISDAFQWSHTIEGDGYWHRLHREFHDNYYNLPTEELEPDHTWDKMWEE